METLPESESELFHYFDEFLNRVGTKFDFYMDINRILYL